MSQVSQVGRRLSLVLGRRWRVAGFGRLSRIWRKFKSGRREPPARTPPRHRDRAPGGRCGFALIKPRAEDATAAAPPVPGRVPNLAGTSSRFPRCLQPPQTSTVGWESGLGWELTGKDLWPYLWRRCENMAGNVAMNAAARGPVSQ